MSRVLIVDDDTDFVRAEILITGGRRDAGQDALHSQSCGMLFKPLDPNALLTAVESAVTLAPAA